MTQKGLLIAFEGGDGSGKSTQAAILASRLNAVSTRQPGGTEIGQRLRAILLEGSVSSSRAEALLFMADRAEQIDQLISPTLERGQHVVCDRYAYSSIAYQGYGRGLDVGELEHIADWSMHGVWPDVVVLIDVPLEVALSRRGQRGEAADHFESDDLQKRVVEGFRAMAAADPERWIVVDGTGSVDEVAAQVWSSFSDRRPLRTG